MEVGFTQFEKWIGYTPCKNNPEAGAALAAKQMPPMTATSSEMDMYAANCKILELGGMKVESGSTMNLNKVETMVGPRVVLAPSFMPAVYRATDRIKGGKISGRSTLVVEGDVTIENLDLDGTLIVKAAKGGPVTIKDLTVRNNGWEVLPLDGVNLPEPVHEEKGWIERVSTLESNIIRGFVMLKNDTSEVASVEGSPLESTGFLGHEAMKP